MRRGMRPKVGLMAVAFPGEGGGIQLLIHPLKDRFGWIKACRQTLIAFAGARGGKGEGVLAWIFLLRQASRLVEHGRGQPVSRRIRSPQGGRGWSRRRGCGRTIRNTGIPLRLGRPELRIDFHLLPSGTGIDDLFLRAVKNSLFGIDAPLRPKPLRVKERIEFGIRGRRCGQRHDDDSQRHRHCDGTPLNHGSIMP